MGFLFGLRSVCEALREVWEEEMGQALDLRHASGKTSTSAESGTARGDEWTVFERAFGDEVDFST